LRSTNGLAYLRPSLNYGQKGFLKIGHRSRNKLLKWTAEHSKIVLFLETSDKPTTDIQNFRWTTGQKKMIPLMYYSAGQAIDIYEF
jgi:hypothetical protein